MSHDKEFCLHELEWTPEKIDRFWDYESQNASKRNEYFTRQVGDALVRLARYSRALVEPVLDYGAGAGHLTMRLVQEKIHCYACDHSPASVAALNRTMTGSAYFHGCEQLRTLPSGLPSGLFGTVFLIETLEHLLPEWKVATLHEVRRLLRPGGYLILTVPYAENLDAAKVICADCGAVFHRVQHMSVFDETGLARSMAESGFEEVLCRPINLALWTDRMQRKGKRFRRALRRLLARAHVLALRQEPTPNLVYIGRNTSD